MAVNFADQLNNIFLLNDTLDELATSVEKKFVIDPCSCYFQQLTWRTLLVLAGVSHSHPILQNWKLLKLA